MAKKRKNKSAPARSNLRWLWGAGVLVVIGVIAAAVIFISQAEQKLSPRFTLGGVTYCQVVPKFALEMGYTVSAIMSTNEQEKGLVVYDPPVNPGDPPTNIYKHPSWDQAGYLGTPVNDKLGNIYVAPAPRVNLYDNPPEQQNTIYKVDTNTGEMAEFVKLPEAPTSSENPFGIIGLAYDCDTNSLYAASIAGSDHIKEIGIIYQINPESGQVVSQLKNVDAFGLSVFNRTLGKRLYFGLARKSEVWSVALDGSGKIKGKSRFEFSMAGWGPDGDDKARRIFFRNLGEMLIRGSNFNYNLIAGSERRQTTYLLRYDPVEDIWLLSETVQ